MVTRLALSLAVVLAIAAAIAPGPAHAARACGFATTADGAHVHVKVIRGRASCRSARRVLRRYLDSTAPCTGSSCVRPDGRWTCQSAPAAAFPRLASCASRRSRVAAYSTAD